MALSEIRTSTITAKGQIVIPGALRTKEGFRNGQKVAILAFEDRLEVRPLKPLAERIDWESEGAKTRLAVKGFAEKHCLKGRKVKEFSAEEKDALAKGFFAQTRRE
ncbi:MAG: AbrB/MazE/SpoVT family DNA-binding domain-containing protein [Candidatus Diapherotrites archaeon]